MKNAKACSHLPETNAKPQSDKCQECGETFNLRVCMTCGHVGCCESSPGQHAKKHFEETGHAVMKSYPPDQEGAFTWCYSCEDYVDTQK